MTLPKHILSQDVLLVPEPVNMVCYIAKDTEDVIKLKT
jgi:hypothetical protein